MWGVSIQTARGGILKRKIELGDGSRGKKTKVQRVASGQWPDGGGTDQGRVCGGV